MRIADYYFYTNYMSKGPHTNFLATIVCKHVCYIFIMHQRNTRTAWIHVCSNYEECLLVLFKQILKWILLLKLGGENTTRHYDENKLNLYFKLWAESIFILQSVYLINFSSLCAEEYGLSRMLIIMHCPAQIIVYVGAGLGSPLSRLCGNW